MDRSTYDLIDVELTNLIRDPASHPFVRLRKMISSAGRRLVQCNPATGRSETWRIITMLTDVSTVFAP